MKVIALALVSARFIVFSALAAPAPATTPPKTAADKMTVTLPGGRVAKKKSTDVNFEDVLVEGKYHFADEAVTTVEGDKIVDALLNVRTDFKDRMRKSASRH